MSVATVTELWRMSATELAQAIRSRQTSSQEVIEAHLRRIEGVNPAVNAVTVVLGEQALEAAKAADRAVAGGGDLPRFHGVPFTVKGNIGARYREDLCLDAAAALEDRVGVITPIGPRWW
jgi:amidase